MKAKEKKVVWLSEVMIKDWASQVTSIEALLKCRETIRKMLTDKTDAVFLDDDNLTGYAGRILVEEVYTWYNSHPNKGLYITSNEPVSFLKSYMDLKLDKSYDCVPFAGYASPQTLNTVIKDTLTGASLRRTTTFDRQMLPIRTRPTHTTQ